MAKVQLSLRVEALRRPLCWGREVNVMHSSCGGIWKWIQKTKFFSAVPRGGLTRHQRTCRYYSCLRKRTKQVNLLCPELWYKFLLKLSKQQQLVHSDHRLSLEFYLRSGEITGCKLYTIPQQTQWFKRKMKSRFTVFTTNTVFGLMFIKLMGKILER